MKKVIAALCFLPLTACDLPPPAVTDFNGDSVTLTWLDYRDMGKDSDKYKAQVDAEAARICAKRSRRAEFASARRTPQYQVEYLYLCL